MERPQQYRFHQGEKTLPFSSDEYDARLSSLRNIMSNRELQKQNVLSKIISLQ